MSLLKKYLFGLIVAVYVMSVVGIPVYMHYCGGELETVTYMMKTDSCCDGEESDEEDNGCCKDEGYILKSSIDCTTKDSTPKIAKNFFPVLTFLFTLEPLEDRGNPLMLAARPDHAARSQDMILSITVLRI